MNDEEKQKLNKMVDDFRKDFLPIFQAEIKDADYEASLLIEISTQGGKYPPLLQTWQDRAEELQAYLNHENIPIGQIQGGGLVTMPLGGSNVSIKTVEAVERWIAKVGYSSKRIPQELPPAILDVKWYCYNKK